MAEIKDFGLVKSWYEAYKETQLNEKKVEDENVKVLPKDEDEEKEKNPEPKAVDDADSLKVENEKLKAEIEKLKLDISKKDAETNVEPNADTGEVPLRVGIAQSILDKKKKDKKEVKEETVEESNVGNYARKLSSYAVKSGGIDRKDFMKIADRISKAKSDMDMKKIGKQVDDMDTEPRDLVKGSIALQMGPKTYKTMFGDRLTSSDMNQYKRMTPKGMREEKLDEGKVKEVMMTVHDVLKKEGGAAGFDVIRKAVKKEDGINITKDSLKRLPGVKMHKFGDFVLESLDEVTMKDGTMTSKQLDSLKKSYSTVGDRIDPEKGMALAKMLGRFGEGELRQLVRKDIKFVSTLAVNQLIMKHKYKAKDIHDIRKKK
tara:strand:- start:38 stop:1159 length:1122 start_codon:yes stop_codon:yes gene_type:complete